MHRKGGTMLLRIFEALLLLAMAEMRMHFHGFAKTYTWVEQRKVKRQRSTKMPPVKTLCTAVDYACVFYPHQVLCLQRSVATTVLLRRHGWDAQLVMGAQLVPHRFHAWCEVHQEVVNDKPYVTEIYLEMQRC